MQEASKALVGEHDYRNLCSMDVANASHFNRKIIEVSIKPVGHTTSTDPKYQLYEAYIKGFATNPNPNPNFEPVILESSLLTLSPA